MTAWCIDLTEVLSSSTKQTQHRVVSRGGFIFRTTQHRRQVRGFVVYPGRSVDTGDVVITVLSTLQSLTTPGQSVDTGDVVKAVPAISNNPRPVCGHG